MGAPAGFEGAPPEPWSKAPPWMNAITGSRELAVVPPGTQTLRYRQSSLSPSPSEWPSVHWLLDAAEAVGARLWGHWFPYAVACRGAEPLNGVEYCQRREPMGGTA